MKLFSDMAKYEFKVKSYEEILEHAKAIKFNESVIEIIGSFIVLNKSGDKIVTGVTKGLNPGAPRIEMEDTEFKALLTQIKKDDKHESVKFIDSGIVPKSTVRLNVDKLVEYSIAVSIYEDAVYFDNNVVITTDIAEFRGSGILSSKDLILKVDQVTFEQILEKLN